MHAAAQCGKLIESIRAAAQYENCSVPHKCKFMPINLPYIHASVHGGLGLGSDSHAVQAPTAIGCPFGIGLGLLLGASLGGPAGPTVA